jgi:hypothetical protein
MGSINIGKSMVFKIKLLLNSKNHVRVSSNVVFLDAIFLNKQFS